MKIKLLPIDKVVPYDKNPRRNANAVAKVAASLSEFGWRQPIVVDAAIVVIAGHTRLLAARHLGMTEVPVLIAADLSAEQARAYRLADNRTGAEATWDADLLKIELGDLRDAGFDLALTGFDDDELASALAEAIAAEEAPVYEEETEQRFCCPSCGFRWSGAANETGTATVA